MSKSKILIVDDNKDFANGLAEFLGCFGHHVDVRFTGESGIEAAGASTYDTIFLDIGLPGINGIESLIKIRESDPDVRCFLMTGFNTDDMKSKCVAAGALEILAKPIDLEELLQRLGGSADRARKVERTV